MNRFPAVPEEFLAVLSRSGHANARTDRAESVSPRSGSLGALDYWRVIALHKWTILGLVTLCALVAAVIVSQMPATYRATAVLLIEGNRPRSITSSSEVYAGVSPDSIFMQTQVELLKSRDVAQRVVRHLNLVTHPEFDPRQRQLAPWQTWLESSSSALSNMVSKDSPRNLREDELEAIVVSRFAQALKVRPIRMSQLIQVQFESRDPVVAATVANAVGDAFALSDREARLRATENAGQWIDSRLADLKTRLESSEKALQAYRDREGVLDPKSTALSGAGRQLDETIHRLADARLRRAEAEAAYQEIRANQPGNHESLPAVVRNVAVQRAKELEQEAQKRLNDTQSVYGSEHPQYRLAEGDVRRARANTQEQVRAVVASMSKEYNAARATEQALEATLARSKGSVQEMNHKETQTSALEREVVTNKKLYEDFLLRSRETSVSLDPERPSARPVDRAIAPNEPSAPNRTLALLIGIVVGALLGVGAALLRGRLDNAVRTADDIESRLRQPFLGALPLLYGERRKNVAGEVLDRPNDIYAEAIRTIGTGVMLSSLDSQRRVIAVTSSVPDEGKSSVSINLAFSHATTHRVLLIEGDMRRPSFAGRCQTPEKKGLAELITRTATFEECALNVMGTKLHVVMAGQLPPNPLDLLRSKGFAELLASLRNTYDTIIIDCPPLQSVSDALVVGRLATGVIYVVKSDHTPIPLANAGLRRIEAANIPIFGVVLNQHNFKKAERYYGEYSGYNKCGYGNGYAYAEAKAQLPHAVH